MSGTRAAALLAVTGIVASASAQEVGDVIITEIFFATNQNFTVPENCTERVQEFVEIYNTTANPIDLSGWTLVDDGTTDPFPAITLMPGEAAVIFGNDGNLANDTICQRITPEIFAAAWDLNPNLSDPIKQIFLEQFETLANGPSSTNEILQIFDASGMLQDEVNYDDAGDWPSDSPQGRSIYLLPQFINGADNNLGCSWARSEPGAGGAYVSNAVAVDADNNVVPVGTEGSVIVFFPEGTETPGDNSGSPGFVQTTVVTVDCNNNMIDDIIEICDGTVSDCNNNGIPDSCEINDDPTLDCDVDGVLDSCQIDDMPELDCDANGFLDTCEIAANPGLDTDFDGALDVCTTIGDVIITEIMFNPPTTENATEWIEIYNTTDNPIDISGWFIGDLEDSVETDFTDLGTIPAGTIIGAGEVMVLIADFAAEETVPFPGVDPVADFRLGWGIPMTTQVIAVPAWGFRANGAGPGDELLGLVEPLMTGVRFQDVVDYDGSSTDGLGWPTDEGTSSYYLRAGNLDHIVNNDGPAWGLSFTGVDGAFDATGTGTAHSSARATGSPGVIDMVGTPAAGDVIITEFINVTNPNDIPFGDDGMGNTTVDIFSPNEFVEIYNTTASNIDVSGWHLRDEDGRTEGLPSGTILAPGEVVVLIQRDVSESGNTFAFASAADAIADFENAWGCGYRIFPLNGWSIDSNFGGPDTRSLRNLSNGPSLGNEVLSLRDASSNLVDLVNFDDDGTIWPDDGTGDPALRAFSRILLPGTYDALSNDFGFNWTVSLVGLEDARTNTETTFWNGPGLTDGSPGLLFGVNTLDLTCDDVCPCDLNGAGADVTDLLDFLSLWFAADPASDFNADGDFNASVLDLLDFLSCWFPANAGAPCP